MLAWLARQPAVVEDKEHGRVEIANFAYGL